jgi:hypothetical protein
MLIMHGDENRCGQSKSMLGLVGMKAQARESIGKGQRLISSTRLATGHELTLRIF